MGEILKCVEALYKGVCSSMGAVSWRRKGERINRDEPDTEMELNCDLLLWSWGASGVLGAEGVRERIMFLGICTYSLTREAQCRGFRRPSPHAHGNNNKSSHDP